MTLQSITINPTSPAKMVAAENPIVVSLATGIVGTPAYAKGRLRVTNDTTNNDQIIFNLTGATTYYKVFTGKRYPNSDSYFLTDTLEDKSGNSISTTITESQIASSIADCLKKDIVISNLYHIDYSGGTIVDLVAKQEGTIFSLAGQVTTTGGGDITFTSISSGANGYQGSLIPNYQMYVEAYVDDKTEELQYLLGGGFDLSTFNYVTDIILPFSLDNIHRFDFSKVCKSFVSTPRPDFSFTGVTSFSASTFQMMRSFLFRYGEVYPLAGGNTAKKLQKGVISPIWVVNSSLDYTDANDMTSFTGASINSNGKYFTNSPTIKHCQRSQKELLYFTITKNAAQNRDLGIYADLTFWDGSTATDVKLYTFLSHENNYGGMYIANVSHADHLAQFETTSKIKTAVINVRSQSGTTDFTIAKTYQYPYTDSDNAFQIAFLSKKGGFDTHTFIGLKQDDIDRTSKDITSAIAVNSDGSITQGFKYSGNYDVQVTKKIVVNSGLLSQQHFDWLIELLESNEIYQIDNSRVNYLKLDSFRYSKNSNTSDFNVECTFIQTIYENSVSV